MSFERSADPGCADLHGYVRPGGVQPARALPPICLFAASRFLRGRRDALFPAQPPPAQAPRRTVPVPFLVAFCAGLRYRKPNSARVRKPNRPGRARPVRVVLGRMDSPALFLPSGQISSVVAGEKRYSGERNDRLCFSPAAASTFIKVVLSRPLKPRTTITTFTCTVV